MGILKGLAESAAGVAVKRGASGLIAGASGLISVRVIAGMAAGVLFVCGLLWWKAAHDRDVANGRLDEVAQVIAAANGDGKPVGRADVVGKVQIIITERATARREREGYKRTSETQTREVKRLSDETSRLRQQSERQMQQVQVLIQQRNRWINQAQAAATRTEPRTDEEELRQMQEALNELYKNGF